MTEVNLGLIKQFVRTWPKRAAVCSMTGLEPTGDFDNNKYDYPMHLVPFCKHPLFQKLDNELQGLILTWGWIGYNQRIITTESTIVNPALLYVADQLLGRDEWDLQESIRQTLVDEHYHTLMHMKAVEYTQQNRKLTQQLMLPPTVACRSLADTQSILVESWQKSLVPVAFATVSEISIGALLNLLANDETIQPFHREVVRAHRNDEYSHSKTLAEIFRVVYTKLDTEKQKFFVKVLPDALRSFVAQDYSMWEAILDQLGVPDYNIILNDCPLKPIVRDYNAIQQFAEKIGILDTLDFDFDT